MGWVRARRKVGSWLALFALALQLAVSFAHIHAQDFATAKPGAVTVAQSAGPAGAPDDDDGPGHVGCAICATIHLARTLLLPTPPAISLPASRTLDRLTYSKHHDAPLALARAFNARAPPQA